jgi:hypothetical protein
MLHGRELFRRWRSVDLVLRGSLRSGMTQCGVMPNAPERKRPVKLPSATASVAEVSLTLLQTSGQ